VTSPLLDLVQLTPTIAMIQAPNRGRFPYANALLVQDGGITALIDTGCGEATLRALQAAYRIDLVICTHSHTDHTGGNWLFDGGPIWMPAGIGFETGGSADRLVRRFIADDTLHDLWLATTLQSTGFRDARITDAYPPGHVFQFGATRLQAIAAPGHLADHTCFWEPSARLLLATDIDFSRFGPWYGNPESDIAAFEESIRRVWALNPQIVVSSHKGVYLDDLDQHFQSYLDHFARRDAQILAALEEPVTLDALVDQALIYGRFPRAAAMLRYFEREMITKHLRRLAKQNLVQQSAPGEWQRV
jgi:glyoxylase-like metal-dependent hydrolase (beta-lactamase superfamily II)